MADELAIDVQINTETCMGSANCMFWAPGVFLVDDVKNHSTVVDVHALDIEKILHAAKGCPTQSIRVYVDGDRLH